MVGSTVAASGAGAAADATAGSDRLRWELIPAVREALAGVIAAPMDPASAPELVVPRAATRFQIVVAVFSMLDQSTPPSLAAPQPAKVTVPHNSTSANCRRLPIARLPPFGYRKVRRTAPAHDRIGLSLHHGFIQGKSAAGHAFSKMCCQNTTARSSAAVRLPISPQISTSASRIVGPAVERAARSRALHPDIARGPGPTIAWPRTDIVIRLAICDARREDFRSVHCSNA